MTKPTFPSKQEIATPAKKIRISLGLRVLILSALCVVLPLVAYIGIEWKGILLEEDRDLFDQLAHVSDAQKDHADLIFREAIVQMMSARIFASQSTDKEQLRRNFQSLLSGFPSRMLCIATPGEENNLNIKMSSEPSFEGHFLTNKDPIQLPLQQMFVFFCFCHPQQMGVIGADLANGEKLLLVFPADSLVQISSDISEWAGTLGVELFQGQTSIIQRQPICQKSKCRIFTDNEVRRILNDDEETPHLDKEIRIAEITQLDTLPLTLQVNIPPIYYTTRHGQVLQYVGVALLLIVIFGAAATWFLTRYMVRPYEHLAKLMHKAGEGSLDVRYEPQYMGFEINQIGSHFNHMMHSLTHAVEDFKKEHAAREKLLHECEIGQAIQAAIFPRVLPQLPQFEIAAHFVAGEDVSGDFYDFFLHDTPQGKRLLIAIGDASGKGVAASMYSFVLRSMLRSFASTGESLEKIAEHANQLFCFDTEAGGMFVTAWIGLLNIADNRLEYTSCGHYPALWRKADGEVMELKTSGSAFGMPFMQTISTQTIQLQKKEFLFLYTDGWVETKRHGVSFNRTRLNELLAKVSPDTSAKIALSSLEAAILDQGEWTSEDRTALAIKLL